MKQPNNTTNQAVFSQPTINSFMVFLEDMNYAGTLFGGKILAEMDKAAAKAARRLLYGTECDGCVTASISKIDFERPAHIGDFIELGAWITKLGKSSIEIDVFVVREDQQGNIEQICKGSFVFVSLKDGKPYAHNCQLGANLN
jgi:acyl-CoA hydrolase